MTSGIARVYFDTSVFVSVLLGQDQVDRSSFDASLVAVQAAQQGRTQGVISALLVAEVVGAPPLRAPQGISRAEAMERMGRAVEYFERTDFHFVEASRRDGLRAAHIAREFDMKGADALHLALAQAAGCRVLFTLDSDQLKVADSIAGLSVSRPLGDVQTTLDVGPQS